ncbi:MAG: AAA family ATPase [Lachnoclostridium sp.]|jgi:predicted AAA+ superfamily ATPase|nr:AAA family ATPase [Lachnoclostridium sp.]
MKRNVMSDLLKWKNSNDRKPMILKGARQVGKTWLMKKFGQEYYDEVIYINFDEKTSESNIFDSSKSAHLIIDKLQIIRNKTIDPQNTLIIFDEIQESANALGSLKYFSENAPEYHIITAGSLLGTYLSKPVSYPVGKVNLLNVYPFSFDEFLEVRHKGLAGYYKSVGNENDFIDTFHDDLLDIYREYLIVGGMPECVNSWINKRDPEDISKKQNEMLTLYENDFTKHNGSVNSARILQVFRSIPSQLAKENNEKFVYGAVREGGRARDFEDAIQWLVSAGITNQIFNVSSSQIPLRPYELLSNFKLFLFDTGLLKNISHVPNIHITLNQNFSFKGQLNENFVLQQLIPQMPFLPNYYASSNEFEIDFLLQKDDRIIPIEVKSGKGKKATSFKRYIETHKPETAIRLNINRYKRNGSITNIPLYFASKLLDLI